MKIGILTFYREINFGANLQALSTYGYLKKSGHDPIFIYYCSEKKEKVWGTIMDFEAQPRCHRDFVDSVIIKQTRVCRDSNDINRIISENAIEAIIVGSDAVLQHHPFIDRIKFSKKRLITIKTAFPDTSYPNPFWGAGINEKVCLTLMSASSQDSEYFHFSSAMKKRMAKDLSRFSYISVRDDWTQKMISSILSITKNNVEVPITPDPVFNFNKNAGEFVLSKEKTLEKFRIPEKYVLVSLFGQHLDYSTLEELKARFSSIGVTCVAFPMQLGYLFQHPFDYEIPIPLIPVDWYALIKYSSGYIGNNMHPVVVALHNAVPCFSLDFYGMTNFWGNSRNEVSSKIYHILNSFGVPNNYCRVIHNKASVSANSIFDGIIHFPTSLVRERANEMSKEYEMMMQKIINVIGNIQRI